MLGDVDMASCYPQSRLREAARGRVAEADGLREDARDDLTRRIAAPALNP